MKAARHLRIEMAAIALAENCPYVSTTYALTELVHTVAPAMKNEQPMSGMIQCCMVSALQPYQKSPTTSKIVPGTMMGMRNSGLPVLPFLWDMCL